MLLIPRHGRRGLNIGNGFSLCLGISPSALISPGSCSYREVFGEKQSGPQPIPGLTEPSGPAFEDEGNLARAGSVRFLPFGPSICQLINVFGGKEWGCGEIFWSIRELASLITRSS